MNIKSLTLHFALSLFDSVSNEALLSKISITSHMSYNVLVRPSMMQSWIMMRFYAKYWLMTAPWHTVTKIMTSLWIGIDPFNAWREEFNSTKKRHISIAKKAINDGKLPWSARIKAMAIADDIDNLKKIYFYYDNRARLPNYDHEYGLGQALFEQNWFCQPVARSHPFHHLYSIHDRYVFRPVHDEEDRNRFNEWAFDLCNPP